MKKNYNMFIILILTMVVILKNEIMQSRFINMSDTSPTQSSIFRIHISKNKKNP